MTITSYRNLVLYGFAVAVVSSNAAIAAEAYAPAIKPSEFTKEVTNPYFNMPVGQKLNYREDTDEGRETTEIWITGETRNIVGVETTVYFDRVYLDGQLIEETKDYVAQNRVTGDVWYFGETVDNYENGKFKDHHGSWIAGENGAHPGIWLKANPRVGDEYRQEYLKGEAEDMVKVLAIGQTVSTAAGNYKDCIKTYDWTPLDVDSKEHKFYCREVGAKVLTIDLKTGRRAELLSVVQGK